MFLRTAHKDSLVIPPLLGDTSNSLDPFVHFPSLRPLSPALRRLSDTVRSKGVLRRVAHIDSLYAKVESMSVIRVEVCAARTNRLGGDQLLWPELYGSPELSWVDEEAP